MSIRPTARRSRWPSPHARLMGPAPMMPGLQEAPLVIFIRAITAMRVITAMRAITAMRVIVGVPKPHTKIEDMILRATALQALKATAGAIPVQRVTTIARGVDVGIVPVLLSTAIPPGVMRHPVRLTSLPSTIARRRPGGAAEARSIKKEISEVAPVTVPGRTAQAPPPANHSSSRLITKRVRHPMPAAMKVMAPPTPHLNFCRSGPVLDPS